MQFHDFFKMTMFLLGLVLFMICPLLEAVYNETDLLIMPFSHTHRGHIGRGKMCPPKTVAVGFRMKIQMPEDTDEL